DRAELFLGIEAGGGAAGQYLAAAVEHAQRRHPSVATREVDHDVHTARKLAAVRLAEGLMDPLHEVLLGVVEEMDGTQLLQACQLGVAARAGDDVRSDEAPELHAAGPHATRGSQDEHLVAALHLPDGVHHAHGGAVGHGQARRRVVGDVVGQGHEVVHGHAAVLGEAAVPHLAEEPARPYTIDGIDHHAIAGLPARHFAARRHDVAGEVHAHDARHGHL